MGERKLDFRLVVRVLKDWRVTIPLEVRAGLKPPLEVGEPFSVSWDGSTQEVTLTRLAFRVVGGTAW